jgi:hypothetical protein
MCRLADSIAALNPHTANNWAALPSPTKQTLLIFVSRVLDSRTTWNGERATSLQGLEWPRKGVVDRYNNVVSAQAVPYNVRWAVVELAMNNIDADRLTVERPDSVVSEMKVGPISLKFANAAEVARDGFKAPEIVTDLLKGLGTLRNSARKITFGRAFRV